MQLLLLHQGCSASPRQAGKHRAQGHPQGGTTTLECSRAKGHCNSLQALQTGTKVRWKKKILVGTDLTRQCPMKGESKKGNRNRGQREKSVRGSVMPETVPGPHGWTPTQSLQKNKATEPLKPSRLKNVCRLGFVKSYLCLLCLLSPRGLSLEYFSGEEQRGLQ